MFFPTFFVLYVVVISTTSASDPHEKKPHHGHDINDIAAQIYGTPSQELDQEALFGDEAKHMENLPSKDVLEHLREIIKRIDTNHDGFIGRGELRGWLHQVQDNMSLAETKRFWEEHGLSPTGSLTWKLYSTQAVEKNGLYESDDPADQKRRLAADKKRWAIADANKDNVLSFEEANVFFSPHKYAIMQDALAEETLEEMDTNKNGVVEFDEYIAHLWKPDEHQPTEPDYVKKERENFGKLRDTNKDGKLDLAELKAARQASVFDFVEAEVKHLFDECDRDKDDRLTEAEVESRHDLFIHGPVTHFGMSVPGHEEL